MSLAIQTRRSAARSSRTQLILCPQPFPARLANEQVFFNDRELSLVCQTPERVKLQGVLIDVVAGITTVLAAVARIHHCDSIR